MHPECQSRCPANTFCNDLSEQMLAHRSLSEGGIQSILDTTPVLPEHIGQATIEDEIILSILSQIRKEYFDKYKDRGIFAAAKLGDEYLSDEKSEAFEAFVDYILDRFEESGLDIESASPYVMFHIQQYNQEEAIAYADSMEHIEQATKDALADIDMTATYETCTIGPRSGVNPETGDLTLYCGSANLTERQIVKTAQIIAKND